MRCLFFVLFCYLFYLLGREVHGASELTVTVRNWRKASRSAAAGLMATGAVPIAPILASLPFNPAGIRSLTFRKLFVY